MNFVRSSFLFVGAFFLVSTVFADAPSIPVSNDIEEMAAAQEKIQSTFAKTKRAFKLTKDLDLDSLNARIASGAISLYATPKKTAPIFYRSDISHLFWGGEGTGGLMLEDGQLDALETVAPHGSILKIEGIVRDGANYVVRVTTPDYPYPTEKGYYMDARMLRLYWAPYGTLDTRYGIERTRQPFPKASVIVERMRSLSGALYVWGGNDPRGIKALQKFYPAKEALSPEMQKKWNLQWVDCSGLLYFATDGLTPRNTSTLVNYGTGLAIAGKSADEILAMLKPLDLLAWRNGHILIVLDDTYLIESNWVMGEVRISETKARLIELLEKKVPSNSVTDPVPEGMKAMVIRRWHNGK